MVYVIYVDLKSSDGKEKKKLFSSDQEAWDWVKKHDGKDIDFRASNINNKMVKDSALYPDNSKMFFSESQAKKLINELERKGFKTYLTMKKDGFGQTQYIVAWDKKKTEDAVKKFKLRLYKLSGPNKGNLDKEEFFETKQQMQKRYKELFDKDNYSLNPTAWYWEGISPVSGGWKRYSEGQIMTKDSKSGVHRITYKDIDGIKQSEIIQGDVNKFNKRVKELEDHDCKILKKEMFMNWSKDALPMTYYTIKVSKFKDDKLRIDVENEYWDKRDYAFYDPKNAKIYSYSSLAADFVDDALKALKIKPSSLKAGMQIRKKVNDALPVKPYFDPLYKDTRRAVVKEAEKYLGEKKLNNSTGKYDKVVWGVRSLLEKTLLQPGTPKFNNAVHSEVDRLLKKYNLTKDAFFGLDELNKFSYSQLIKLKDKTDKELKEISKKYNKALRNNSKDKSALGISMSGKERAYFELDNEIKKREKEGRTNDASYFENSNGTKYEVLMKSNSGKHGLLKSPSGQYIVAYNMRNDSWDQGHYFGSDYEKAKKFFLKGYVKDEAMEKEYSYSIKIGGDLKRVKVKANNSDEALEKVKKEAIRFKADRVKTKFDNNKLSTRDLR